MTFICSETQNGDLIIVKKSSYYNKNRNKLYYINNIVCIKDHTFLYGIFPLDCLNTKPQRCVYNFNRHDNTIKIDVIYKDNVDVITTHTIQLHEKGSEKVKLMSGEMFTTNEMEKILSFYIRKKRSASEEPSEEGEIPNENEASPLNISKKRKV